MKLGTSNMLLHSLGKHLGKATIVSQNNRKIAQQNCEYFYFAIEQSEARSG